MLLNNGTRNMRQASIIFALLLPWLPGGVFAADNDRLLYCPESIKVTENASGIDATWEITLDNGRRGYFLDDIRFYSGHPSQMASLVPDSTSRSANERKSIWRFPSDSSTGYWIACSYQNTRLLVTKKLPKNVKTCQVNEQLLPSGVVLKVKGVACQ